MFNPTCDNNRNWPPLIRLSSRIYREVRKELRGKGGFKRKHIHKNNGLQLSQEAERCQKLPSGNIAEKLF